MCAYRSRLIWLVLFCWSAVLLAQCAPVTTTTDPVWLTRLDPGGSYSYREAKWSPNSEQIVLTRREVVSGDPVYEKTRSSEIFVMDVGTREVRQLTHNDYFDLAPVWAPYGNRIPYIRDGAVYGDQAEKYVKPGSIRIMNSDGTDDREIFSCPYGCWWLAWSPRDDRIAFTMRLSKHVPGQTVDGPSAEVFLIDTDGSNLVQLTEGDSPAGDSGWSSDGQQIAFLRSDRSIRVLNIQDRVETAYAVGDMLAINSPLWSADQSRIIFSAGQRDRPLAQLFSLNLSNGQIAPVFDTLLNMPEIDMYEPDWSPDGTKLVFTSFLRKLYLVDTVAAGLSK